MAELKGSTIQAIDGEIGTLAELLFDERDWRVRYLVVDVGSWLFGRQVLVVPEAVSGIDREAGQVAVTLTKLSISDSPELSVHEPVSREKERALHAYFQWSPYWRGGATDPWLMPTIPPLVVKDGPHADASPEPNGEELNSEAEEPRLRSTSEVTGYRIQSQDGEIGSVTDFLFDDQSWAIRLLVVDTGRWLPGRKVLMAPPWVEDVRWAEKSVYVNLTQESVRDSPPFEEDLLDIEHYEKDLLAHYRLWFAQLLEHDNRKGAEPMFLGKDIIGNPVISVDEGRSIGRAQDLYLSDDCRSVSGIYLGTEGLFSRQSFLVKNEDVVTIGPDAVLVKRSDVIHEEENVAETDEGWLRRDELQGRPVDTPGGTKVGKIGDVIMDKEGAVLGFSLSQVYVAGPVADNRSVAIHTVQDVGWQDGVMTVNLQRAEEQELSVV